ncbi:MAG TPA: lytic transglycosylase domain-containing protein [Thermoanaerobaculia bacterium]|nr:lytic transglycosylase domain-containing protein [Thermoanaerobaculia bacterium]
MRPLVVFAVVAALASSAASQVQVVVGADGKKTISNFGVSSAHNGDLRWLARQRNRRSAYDAIIDRHAVAYGVDPVLVRAVIQVESDFDPQCISHKGARGLMQLMPDTARRYGVKSIFDPEENIRGGIRYLGDLLTMFHNDLPRALAAYNAGEGAVLKYAGIPPYPETSTYIARALTVYYGQPYGQATAFAGSRSAKLKGGFMAPVAAAVLPGMRYLGSQ